MKKFLLFILVLSMNLVWAQEENPDCYQDTGRNIDLDRSLLLANTAANLIAAYGVINVDPHQDKVRHFLAGYVIANGTNGAVQLLLPREMKHRKLIAALAGLGTSALVAVGKEYWDSLGHGNPSSKDAWATTLGGAAGTITISLIDVKNAFRKKPKVDPLIDYLN